MFKLRLYPILVYVLIMSFSTIALGAEADNVPEYKGEVCIKAYSQSNTFVLKLAVVAYGKEYCSLHGAIIDKPRVTPIHGSAVIADSEIKITLNSSDTDVYSDTFNIFINPIDKSGIFHRISHVVMVTSAEGETNYATLTMYGSVEIISCPK